MKITSIGRVYPQVGWYMEAHKHTDNHEAIVLLNGILQVIMEGHTYEVHPGEMIIYPRNVTHIEHSIGQQPLESIFFAWTQENDEEVKTWPRKGRDVLGRIQTLARWMYEITPPKIRQDQHIIQIALEMILYEFHNSHIPADEQLEIRLRRYLQEHLAEQLTLDDLAKAIGITKYHFVRKFKNETGISPMAYLRQIRVQNAKNLLGNTPLPIKNIAPQVGLVDEYHFSRVFSRVVGLSPREYRKSIQKQTVGGT